MLHSERAAAGAGVSKIVTIDDDARNVDPSAIDPRPQICFVDGEHVDESVFSDFLFCLKVLDEDGLLIFHDAQVVYKGLARVVAYLEEQGVLFHTYNLPDQLLVVEVGEFPMHRCESIHEMLLNNYVGYLTALEFNDQYRRCYNRHFFQRLRHLKRRLRGAKDHISE